MVPIRLRVRIALDHRRAELSRLGIVVIIIVVGEIEVGNNAVAETMSDRLLHVHRLQGDVHLRDVLQNHNRAVVLVSPFILDAIGA
jgi:hypothetical protein